MRRHKVKHFVGIVSIKDVLRQVDSGRRRDRAGLSALGRLHGALVPRGRLAAVWAQTSR